MPLLLPPGPDLRPSELTYTDGYNSIVSRVQRRRGTGSGGIVIICGVDLDGLLAARILTSLFKQDNVPYQLVPVGGYTDLDIKSREALKSEDLHTLILLSLGSILPLANFFDLPRGVHLHVLDARRPWNLSNLFGIALDEDNDGEESSEGKIWTWGDGNEIKLDSVKKSWETLEYEPDSDSDSDSEVDDEDDEDEDGTGNGHDDEDGEESGGENGNGVHLGKRSRESSSKPKKRRREGERPRKMPRAVREAHVERVSRYYEAGTSFGMSVAQTVYLLATELERADNDLLWLAILAVTHQYVAAQIDRKRYGMFHDLLSDEVVRLNPPVTSREPDADNRRISRSDELRFVLFRHWNLYDSMLHSSYVAARMGIWRERGQKRIQGLLAKMGYSMQECKQAYAHMDLKLKKELPEKLDAIAPEYGLVELEYPSFVRAFGFEVAVMSAADAVEGLTALLEAATGLRLEVEVEGGRGGGEWFGAMRTWSVGGDYSVIERDNAPTEEADVELGKEDKSKQCLSANFWITFDACGDIALLKKSLPLAKALHCAIIRQGTAILDKGTIRPLHKFRFTAVKEGPDLRMFSKPAALARLALWLMDATRDRWTDRETRKGHKVTSLPFVLAVLNEEKRTYTVVGVTGAPEFGDVRKNKFGLAFQQAAHESQVTCNELFDTSVIEIPDVDLQGFMEVLAMRSVTI
ncbi:hypothetical protein CcaverHIS002_0312070 [Cutaneotrichosporon cavernicola]|uniref:CDC45-like protein n=1 Tax=Cutaneotrichosporon cavernicola TaxID=279322 RepID=A0AA48L375_9TREE|nr:uncharacterized protein CcaverHIS019_0311930 [Cutaneotrichosporon cavernicola]BEI83339.1 hypothetical protein CcaverHIS002_0312070 [Cutaneotrichosporon cavernicola]BEI91123.1 hypothetical protein CcaverHIS019_0311930 [Cutaneotrichosporon cavernicola]BEI98900.1 hypothetical protein CcaverHIS631_0311990 [Cutaneotrichosporon cavernicola]BEJ06673.1 hypothetical protein CcaverHIS641_0311950 [Cutaneotrichosporon cavernicola]